MGRNCRGLRRGLARFGNEYDDMRQRRKGALLGELRNRFHRSPDGILLGVFRGIAESLGYSVCWVRIIGCFVLLILSGSSQLHSCILVAGFFYILAAILMGPPQGAGDPRLASGAGGGRVFSPDMPRDTRASRTRAVPFQEVRRPRVDLAAMDRQLDGLNRRIQRMETIVTDRQYDWDRRLERE